MQRLKRPEEQQRWRRPREGLRMKRELRRRLRNRRRLRQWQAAQAAIAAQGRCTHCLGGGSLEGIGGWWGAIAQRYLGVQEGEGP